MAGVSQNYDKANEQPAATAAKDDSGGKMKECLKPEREKTGGNFVRKLGLSKKMCTGELRKPRMSSPICILREYLSFHQC